LITFVKKIQPFLQIAEEMRKAGGWRGICQRLLPSKCEDVRPRCPKDRGNFKGEVAGRRVKGPNFAGHKLEHATHGKESREEFDAGKK